MDKFSPKEGDRILVGWVDDEIDNERTYLYTNNAGSFVCVESTFEKEYRKGADTYTVIAWPYAKPLPPKIPEFIKGDPVILDIDGLEGIRIVNRVDEDGMIWCFPEGMLSGTHCTPWNRYKPLPNYDYGNRKVWGAEDNK